MSIRLWSLAAGGVIAASLAILPEPARATETAGVFQVEPAWFEALEARLAAQPDPRPPTMFWQVANGAASIDPVVADPAYEFGILLKPTDARALDPLSTEEPVIDVLNLAFLPAITVVSEGNSVLVRNSDLFDHDFVVEEVQTSTAVPLEEVDAGRAYRVRFKTHGLYAIRCRQYSFLRGYVFVENAPFRFVHPDAAGGFNLRDLPPGRYTITVFNATVESASAAAPAAAAGWVAGSCTVDVPAPPPAVAAAPAAPPPPEGERPRRPEAAPAAPAAPPPPPAPPVFTVTVKLLRRGTSGEGLECVGAFPAPPAAPAAPAGGAAPAAAGQR